MKVAPFFIMFFFCILSVRDASAVEKVRPLEWDGHAKALVIEDAALPMVTLQLSFVGAGSLSDGKDKAGLAAMAAELLTEGAGEYNARRFHEALEEKAISLSASAGQDVLRITLKTLTENLDTALELLTLAVTKPRFDAEALERVREQQLSVLRQSQQNPAWYAYRQWQEAAYPNHPYGQPAEGTEDSIATVKREDFIRWHQQNLAQNRLQVAVVGNITTDTVQAKLKPLIDNLPEFAGAQTPETEALWPKDSLLKLHEMEVPQTVVFFGSPALPRQHPDFYAAYLVNHILGGGSLVSRLSHALREEKGYTYSVSTSIAPALLSSIIMGSFATRNAEVQPAIDTLQQSLQKLLQQGITQKELDNAKQFLMGSFPLELDSQSARAGYLSSMLLYGLGADYLEQRNAYFKRVTLKDVNRVAKDLLSQPPIITLAGNPPQEIEWKEP